MRDGKCSGAKMCAWLGALFVHWNCSFKLLYLKHDYFCWRKFSQIISRTYSLILVACEVNLCVMSAVQIFNLVFSSCYFEVWEIK